MSNKLNFSKNYDVEKQRLIEAVEQKDVSVIDSLCNKLSIDRSDLLDTIGDEWLIYVSSKEAIEWFWLLLMKLEDYHQMINGIKRQTITLLLDAGCKHNIDFKTTDCNGEYCVTFLSQKAQDTLIELVPSEHQQQIHKLFQQPTTEYSAVVK